MFRTITASVIVALAISVSPVRAEERPATGPVAPNAVVAAAWAREAGGSSPALKALLVSYVAVQGLDMASTIKARNRGAVEANPMMQGSYAEGFAVKAALGAVPLLAVRQIEKKNKKAAIFTMIAANVGTAAVIAHNMRNANRLR